jgi:hypothetical protein
MVHNGELYLTHKASKWLWRLNVVNGKHGLIETVIIMRRMLTSKAENLINVA